MTYSALALMCSRIWFEGRLHGTVQVHGRDAVIPSIRGRAWITGINQHILCPDDPFPRGFTLGDIWATSSF